MKRVLFLCTENACRSQMAEGLANAPLKGRVQAFSAGTKPSKVHRLAVKALLERGIDIGNARSKHVDEFMGRHFDMVVTVCDNARQSCPAWPGQGKRLHYGLEDPAAAQGSEAKGLASFRKVSDHIAKVLIPLIVTELGL